MYLNRVKIDPMSTPAALNSMMSQPANLVNTTWLSTVVANLPQAVLLEDDAHQVRIANEQLCRLFGFSETPEQLTGGKSSDLFLQVSTLFENPEQYSHLIRSLVKEKQTAQKEMVRLKDGRILLLDYIPLWQDGRLTGHMWMFSEETEKIKADDLLKTQQKFYEDILNSIPSDIAVFSPEQRYLYINPVGVRDPEMRKWLIGKDDFEYCLLRGKDMAFAEQRRKSFNQIVATGKEIEWEEKIVNRQGENEFHLRKMSPLYDEKGQLVWVIGYSVNITERKKFEQKIQDSERRYRNLFNFSQAIICTHDLDGKLLSVNPSLQEVFGYDEEDIIGRNIRDFLLPEDQGAFQDLYINSINEHGKMNGLFRVQHRSGRMVYLLYQNYKMAESPDSPAYVIAFAQDVSDRIKAEKELKEAKKLTEETARNKERFLANMSHEIRTPMNGVIGITSFLQKTELTEEQRNYLNIIQDSAHDLLIIINDILDLEKVGTGKIQLEKIPFDVVAKTNTVLRLFELAAGNKGVKIVFENELGSDLCVKGDPTRFNQIMNNLISNAVKFTHHGEVRVKISIVEQKGQQVKLRFIVEDTGIGIEPGNLSRIFQPFTQAYPETARKYGGSGLGLAITKNLVELQGGEIEVSSRPKKGSAFCFYLSYELCTEAEKQMLAPPGEVKNELGPLRILLAEDNEVNQLLTKGMLEFMGFDPLVVPNGAEALNIFQQQEFDLVLMDIQMPEMDGLEATAAIRALPSKEKSGIPIVALTANALHGESDKCIAAGMNAYLAKPFTEQALYQVIVSVMNPGSENTETGTIKNENMDQTQAQEKLYDLALVNELARGSQEFISNLAKIFIDTVPPTSAEMVTACEQGNWEQVGKLAHKLKSTVDTLCINVLREDIRAIEKNGKEKKNLESIPPMVKKTDEVIREAATQLKAEFGL